MQVTITGRNPMGHPHVARARRFWSGSPRTVEVIDVKAGDYMKKVEGRDVPCEDGDDPPDIIEKRRNPTTNRMIDVMVPDPDRIGKKSFAALMADARISIKQGDTVSEQAADAAIAAARAEAGRLSAEVVDLKAELAKKQSEIDRLNNELATHKELLEAATKPAGGGGADGG